MTSTEIVNSLFAGVITNVQNFITSDLMAMVAGFLSLLFGLFAYVKVVEFFRMSQEESDARSSFKAMRDSRGGWDYALKRKKYMRALRSYEEYENRN